LTEQIKSSCTFIYELAVLIAGIVKRETGYYIDQNEMAYIAIHIGGMLQIQQSLRNKARCLLLFPQYYDFANKLIEQLTQAFGASLVFVGVATQPEDIEQYQSIDMILSTVDMNPNMDAEVVFINPFLSERDSAAIKQSLQTVIRKKKSQRVRKSLFAISNPNMFAIDKQFKDSDEAIRFMTKEMIARHYVEASFTDAVLEREKNYSTAYGSVAIPHALQMNAKKTGMYICLCEKPVPWGETRVQIILLFSVNREDKSRFYEVFENLIVLLLEPANALRVALCKTYEQFTETILECL
jgi:Mannitol/fructose-specific phosphotransferase system, IIA domain